MLLQHALNRLLSLLPLPVAQGILIFMLVSLVVTLIWLINKLSRLERDL